MLINLKGDVSFACYYENSQLTALGHSSILESNNLDDYVLLGDYILDANAEIQFKTPLGVKFGLTVRASEINFSSQSLLTLAKFRRLGSSDSYELTDFGNAHQLLLRYIAYSKVLHTNCDYELNSLDTMVVKQFRQRAPKLT